VLRRALDLGIGALKGTTETGREKERHDLFAGVGLIRRNG